MSWATAIACENYDKKFQTALFITRWSQMFHPYFYLYYKKHVSEHKQMMCDIEIVNKLVKKILF